MKNRKTVYMCTTEFDCELGEHSHGVRVFPSVEELKDKCSCWPECGIVEVECRVKEIVEEGRYPVASDLKRLITWI